MDKVDADNERYGSKEYFQRRLEEIPGEIKSALETPLTLARITKTAFVFSAAGALEVVADNFVKKPIEYGLFGRIVEFMKTKDLLNWPYPNDQVTGWATWEFAKNVGTVERVIASRNDPSIDPVCAQAVEVVSQIIGSSDELPTFQPVNNFRDLPPDLESAVNRLNDVCEPKGLIEGINTVINRSGLDASDGVNKAIQSLRQNPREELPKLAQETGLLAGAAFAVDTMLVFAENHFNQPNPKNDEGKLWEKIKKRARETGVYAKPMSELSKFKQGVRVAIDVTAGSVLLGIYEYAKR